MLVLLDRDGVLVEDRSDFVKHPGELVLLPGAAAAVRDLKRAGHRIAVCTNQSCVGRGIVSPDMLERIHLALCDMLQREGGTLDQIFVCTDAPSAASSRRKPAPGMLQEAMRHFRLPPDATLMIGDQLKDLQAAKAAGCRRMLVRTGRGAETLAAGIPPDLLPLAVHDDLSAAVASLLAEAA